MEEGLQPQHTPLVPRQSHAAGICNEVETGNQDRMRPEINRRILPKAGGSAGLRSIRGQPNLRKRRQTMKRTRRTEVQIVGILRGSLW